MTIPGILVILIPTVIITALTFSLGIFAEKTSKSKSVPISIPLTGIVLVLILAIFLVFSKFETTSSKNYQLKLNSEGHTAYSMQSGSDFSYDKYKVTTINNKNITVENPDDIVYNQTKKSKLKITTTNSYVTVFGHNIKMNIDKTQTIYIIK